MRSILFLMLLANGLAAQAPLRNGEPVLIRSGAEQRYRIFGIVQAAGPDSATVLTRNGCVGTQESTISYAQLMVRVPAGRMTIPYAIGGAMNAFMLGKIAAHVVRHNGGGIEGARAARYGAALMIPFSALKGYEKRVGRWVPVLDLRPGMEHMPVMPEDNYLLRPCPASRRGSPLGNDP